MRNTTQTINVTYKNQILDVKGTYFRGTFGNRETPPECSEFEIETIFYKGIDITDLFFEFQDTDEELQELIINQIED